MTTSPAIYSHPVFLRLKELLAEVPKPEKRLLLAELVLLDCQMEALDKAEMVLEDIKSDRQMAVADQVLSAIKAVRREEDLMRRELAKAEEQRYRRILRDRKQSTDKVRKSAESCTTQKLPWLD